MKEKNKYGTELNKFLGILFGEYFKRHDGYIELRFIEKR